jgi:sugar phosphate permease
MGVGGALAPVTTAYLIEAVGWRWAFVLFGAVGVVWAWAFYTWFRDDPAEHSGVNEAERLLLSSGPSVSKPEVHPPVPWGLVLRSANIWLLGAIMSCAAFAGYMYMMWYPNYLREGRGVSNVETGWLAGLVMAGGATGSLLGGCLSDWLVHRTGERRWSRRLIGAGGLSLASIALCSSIYCDSPVVAASFTATAALSAQLAIASWWIVTTEISGKHLGALFGLVNSMGFPGSLGSQLFFGWFADWQHDRGLTGRAQWDPAFYVYAAVLLTGACCWLFVDATKSAVEPRG